MVERLGLLNKLLGDAAKAGWPTWHTGGSDDCSIKLGVVEFLTSAIHSCADIDKSRGGNKRDIDNDTWALILDMCPALRRYFRQCESEN